MIQGQVNSVRLQGLETPEEKTQRLRSQFNNKNFRATKTYRRKGGAGHDIDIANIFLQLGLDYFASPPGETLKQVPVKLEGRRVDSLTPKALHFLKENFDVGQVEDAEGRVLLHFVKERKITNEGEETNMSLLADVAEHCDQPRKVVKEVLEAFNGAVHDALKKERAIRIPGLGKLTVKYRPAKPKRKGTNPFTGKPAVFKAKPASNKLRFRPSKDLKKFVEKLPVVAPKKKHKKGKKKSKK